MEYGTGGHGEEAALSEKQRRRLKRITLALASLSFFSLVGIGLSSVEFFSPAACSSARTGLLKNQAQAAVQAEEHDAEAKEAAGGQTEGRTGVSLSPAESAKGGENKAKNHRGTAGAEGASDTSGPGQDKSPAQASFPVYICGEVRQPGVVNLKQGSYLEQAIAACGGFTEKADRQAVNLAMQMRANIMVEVPALGEREPADSRPEGYVDSLQADPAGMSRSDAGGAGGQRDRRIDINAATETELTTIPGIGAATAKRIVAYREQVGRFKSPEELMQVPGIKSGKYEAMRDLICVN